MMPMEQLKTILNKTIKKMGLHTQIIVHKIVDNWEHIIGGQVAQHAMAECFDQGILYIRTDSGVWAHHLSLIKRELIAKINRFAGETIVEDIRFRGGEWQKKPKNINGKIAEIGDIQDLSLPQGEIAAINELVQPVQDEAVRTQLRRLILADKIWKKRRQLAGWKHCACGGLCPPEEAACHYCRRQFNERRRLRLRKLLWEMPWLKFEELPAEEQFSPADYTAARRELLDKTHTLIMAASAQPDADTPRLWPLICTYVMLRQQASPESLNEQIIIDTLGENIVKKMSRGKQHVLTPRC